MATAVGREVPPGETEALRASKDLRVTIVPGKKHALSARLDAVRDDASRSP
jgi:hypothetical protein